MKGKGATTQIKIYFTSSGEMCKEVCMVEPCFPVFFVKFLNIVFLDQIQKPHIVDKKKLQSLKQATQKEILNECSSSLKIFLQKISMFLFLSPNIECTSLTLNMQENL